MTSSEPTSWSSLIKQYDASRKKSIKVPIPSVVTYKAVKSKEAEYNPVTQKFVDNTREDERSSSQRLTFFNQVKTGYERQLKQTHTPFNIVTHNCKPGVKLREKPKTPPRLGTLRASYCNYNITAPPPPAENSKPIRVYNCAKSCEYNIVAPDPVIAKPRKLTSPPTFKEKPQGKKILSNRSTATLSKVLQSSFESEPFTTVKVKRGRSVRSAEGSMRKTNDNFCMRQEERRRARFQDNHFDCCEYQEGYNPVTNLPCSGLDSHPIAPLRTASRPSITELLG
ncbi:hypothetical protein GEMRC1_004686 [Eukaryota sp. GEM-RC1]